VRSTLICLSALVAPQCRAPLPALTRSTPSRILVCHRIASRFILLHLTRSSRELAGGARLLHALVEAARVPSLAKDSNEADSPQNLFSAGLQGGMSAEEGGGVVGSAGLVECARMAWSSGAWDGGKMALRDSASGAGGVRGWKVEAVQTEQAVGFRLAALVGRCRLVHAPQLLVACAAFALRGLRDDEAVGKALTADGPAVREGPKESAAWEGVAYLCKVCGVLLAGCAHPAAQEGDLKQGSCGGGAQDGGDIGGNSTGVVLTTRGEEITSLAVLVLIDALLPSLALAVSSHRCFEGASAEGAAAREEGRVRVGGELHALLRGVEAVSFATRPDGSSFAAHLKVGARLRAHLLLLLRSLDP